MGWRSRTALLPWLAFLLLCRQARCTLQTIAAGGQHSCTILQDQNLRCWGGNDYGQLGYGDTEPRGDEANEMGNSLPLVDLGTGRTAVAIAFGYYHSCALLDDGAMKCWGQNFYGQLGQEDQEYRGDEPNEMGDNLPPINLGTDRTAIAIAAGNDHSCALLDNRDVKCWGYNLFSQLGLGDTETRGDDPGEMGDSLPAVDLGTGFTAIAIAAGGYHTCALSDAGQIKCWGDNSRGQLGQGYTTDRQTAPVTQMGDNLPPVDLGTNGPAVAIAAGSQHTCALLANGFVKCWGSNGYGQLGYGDVTTRGSSTDQMGDRLPFVDLGANRTAVAVVATARFTCALLDNGMAKCWGDNQYGQLGQEDTEDRGDESNEMGDILPPIDLGTGRTAIALAAGNYHAIVSLDDGTLKAWGGNFNGQLGVGHTDPVGTTASTMGDDMPPVDLGDNMFSVCQLGSFGQWSCAECPAGTWALAGAASDVECIKCRGGYSPSTGATQCVSCDPGTASSVEGATSAETAACKSCDAGKYSPYSGAALCTACTAGTYSNVIGATDEDVCQLCPAGTSSKEAAAECTNCPLGTYSVSGRGGCFSCPRGTFSNRTGCVDCPAGLTAEPGSSSSTDCYPPSDSLPSGGSMRVFGAGGSHSCAVLELGMLKCWGYNGNGQLGYGDMEVRGDGSDDMGSNLAVVDLGEDQPAAAVALGASHSCVLLANGAAKCWGRNVYGELGQGDKITRADGPNEMGDNLPPINLGTGRTAIAIAAGGAHSCALLDNRDVKCWGWNDYVQLGLGDNEDRGDGPGEMGDNLPAVDLGTGFTAIAIAAGGYHTCALSDAGQIKCWGANYQGQLGQGDTGFRGIGADQMGDNLPPVDLGTNGPAVAIAAGDEHTCALLANGFVKCWGINRYGQLGYGDTENRGDEANEMGDNLHLVDLGANRTAVAVVTTARFTCALLDNGMAKCWGRNDFGQLGQEDKENRGDEPNEMGDNLPPIKLGTGRTARTIMAGGAHVMVLLDDGTLKAWGDNFNGQLGLASTEHIGDSAGTMGDNLPSIDLGGEPFPVCQLGSFGQWSCAECPAGTWALAGAASDVECIKCRGGYSPSTGATQCVSCDPGTASSVEGATSAETAACKSCDAGKYSPYSGAALCTACTAGTYSNVIGATDEDVCEICPVGKFSASAAADTCELCEAGRYADIQGSPECTGCTAGKYSNVTGATSSDVCQLCPAGTYSSMEGLPSLSGCVPCVAGTYSASPGASSEDACLACSSGTHSSVPGAVNPDTCQECTPGRYAEPGQSDCDDCSPGKYASRAGAGSCHTCEIGTYSVQTRCASCPAGKTSAEGSASEEECESMTSSFAVGGLLMVVTIAVVLVYIIRGRAAAVADKERQSALLPIIHACANISAHILATMKRRQETGGVWKSVMVVMLTVALFVTTVLTFLTNTFLLSRSFLAPPAWTEALEEEITGLISYLPPLSFLYVVPPVVRFIESIEFTALLNGMDVSCSGAQAPLVLFMNALIVIGTIVMIGSQLHIVMALALGPAIGLTRDKLIAMPDASFIVRAKNMVRFLMLLIVSSFFHSFSRYTMQVFATLINYADFIPYHEWTRGCNHGEKGDELLATASTVLFYLAVIPVLLLIIPIMMPGRQEHSSNTVAEPGTACAQDHHLDESSPKTSSKRSTVQKLLDCINPFRWLLFGVDWLLKSLYGHAAMQQPDMRQLDTRDLVQHNAVQETNVLGCASCLKGFCCCCYEDQISVCGIIATCFWKVKLSMYLALGIWTDEIVQNLQVDDIARQHFGWTFDHTRSYEDVMAAAGPMRSMVWMLVPVTIVLTKLSEATNNPPVFVRSGLVKMASPVLFGSWKAAEQVMLEGRALLNNWSGDATQSASAGSGLEHHVLVVLVWIFGARLPQYLVNMTVIVLAATAAFQPAMRVLMVAVLILLPWAFLHALAIVMDVKTMLSLRKLAGASDKSLRPQSVEMPAVAVAVAQPLGVKGENADISAFYA